MDDEVMSVGTAHNRHRIERLLVQIIAVKYGKINDTDLPSSIDEQIFILHQKNGYTFKKMVKSRVDHPYITQRGIEMFKCHNCHTSNVRLWERSILRLR